MLIEFTWAILIPRLSNFLRNSTIYCLMFLYLVTFPERQDFVAMPVTSCIKDICSNLSLSNQWRETKLFQIVTGTATKPWLSGNMLPNINTCKNGWSKLSENLRIMALKLLWPGEQASHDRYPSSSPELSRRPSVKNPKLQRQPPSAISYFLWFVSLLNVLRDRVWVTKKKTFSGYRAAWLEMDRKVCPTTTTSYTKELELLLLHFVWSNAHGNTFYLWSCLTYRHWWNKYAKEFQQTTIILIDEQ